MNTPNFEKELEQLINKHSIENQSNTPDFILSRYLMNCLQTLNILTERREDWYGRKPKEMEGVGFKDVEDCSRNKSVESGLMACNPKYLNETSLCLSKQDSGLEKIIKYVSRLNHTFGHPYYFTWSLANNYYDESPSGVLKDPGYASLRVGRHIATGKNLEMLLLFGPINSIVDTHMAFRYLVDPKDGEVNFELNPFELSICKGLIDASLQKMYGNSWDDFMVIPPAEGKPLPIPQDDIKQTIPELMPKEKAIQKTLEDIKGEQVIEKCTRPSESPVFDPYLRGTLDADCKWKPKQNPFDPVRNSNMYSQYELGYENSIKDHKIEELNDLVKLLRKQCQEYGERAETNAKKLEAYVQCSNKEIEGLKEKHSDIDKFTKEELDQLQSKVDMLRKFIGK